jgi:hypothetical protein
MKLRGFMVAAMIAAALSFSACGGTSAKTTPAGFTIGGTVSGLPSHLLGFNGLELQDNGGAEMPVGDNGSFTFPTAVASGATYSVTVTVDPDNPIAQTCVVTNGNGTATADVTTVQITCTTTNFTIGGTVSGLTGTMVLQDNGGDNLSVSGNGSFTFATSLASGSAYAVTVLTQPSGQTCFVNNGSGNVGKRNVTGVTVTCAAGNGTFTIGGTVTGLTGSGMVLQDNLSNNLMITGNGSFTFSTAIAAGSGYSVTVLTQPSSPTQSCTVGNASGTVGNMNVTTVVVTCAAVPAYTIGGSILGLTGSGLVLEDNGGDNLSPTGNGSFTFATPVASGATYRVTVLTEPTNPTQTCTIANGGGTVGNANVTTVQISCAAGVVNEWTWVNGSNTVNQLATYGTLSTPAAGNVPGAREGSATWTDLSGNLWLFGGGGFATANIGYLNDLWEFNPSTGEWTWMGGSNVINQKGVYGTLGLADPGNIPGARQYAMSWTDSYGNFWLFGGTGYDSSGANDLLNDLWEYEPSTGEWTWVSGANVIDQSAVFGTEGTPDPGNVPSSRFDGQTWADAHGNLWLFGGEVYCAQCGRGSNTYGNDLWEFNPTTVEWTWVSGTNEVNQPGVYGTEGTPAAGNMPPYTAEATTWTDAAGAFWMFAGGSNILWRYSGGQWTWIDGVPPTQCCSNPYYGTLGTPGPNNIPGGRILTVQWMDGFGNAWIFGGYGEDSEGNDNPLNDLWRYSPGVNEWTWMGGSNVVNQKGVYGTKGVAAPGNIPGARWDAISWTDSSGNFWLFGGGGYDSNGTDDLLNDLWEFKP